jgi:hypothetical protein
MLQFLVLCYGLLGDRMVNSTAVLFDVNDGPSPLQIGGNLNCLKSHYVMHCLDEDVARKMCVDDTVGASRRCRQLWRGTIVAFIVRLNDVVRGGSGCWCRCLHPFSVGEWTQVMWDHRWNNRRYNQKSLRQIEWLGPHWSCLWARQWDHRWECARWLVQHMEPSWALFWWPWSSGWSISRDVVIMLGKKGCRGTTIAGNDRVIIIVIVIVCQDLEGVGVLCQTLVYDW